MLAAGAWEIGQCDKWVSKAFLVPKKTTDGSKNYRLVCDLRPINKHCRVRNMTMERMRDVGQMGLEQGSLMFSFDIQDGFYGISIDRDHRDYMTFQLPDGTLIRYAALPMGYCNSPYVFCTAMKSLTTLIRSPGLPATGTALADQLLSDPTRSRRLVRVGGRRVAAPTRLPLPPQPPLEIEVLSYVDDFLCWVRGPRGRVRRDVLVARDRVAAALETLGLTRHATKGMWEPATQCEHLGVVVDTARGQFLLSAAKVARIRAFATNMLQLAAKYRRLVNARALASFTGLVQSCYLAIPSARMFQRSLHDVLRTKQSWDSRVRLSRQAWSDLEWWIALPARALGRAIWRRPTTVEVFSDSSDFAWGATLRGQRDAGGMWSPTIRREHIQLKEMRAAHEAILAYLPALQGQHVKFQEDNQCVMYVVKNRTSRSPALMRLVRRFYAMLDLHSITVEMVYCPTALNSADAPSRIVDRNDWKLAPAVFAHVDRLWGPHTHDRFASATTSQCAMWTAPRLQPGCAAVDAWASAPWAGNNWLNPGWQGGRRPMAHLARLASLLTQMPDVEGTVVAPYWPHRWEFHALRSQAADMLVMPAEPALYQPAAPEVFVPSCRSLAFLRVLPGLVRALQPTAHAQQE